MEEVRVLKVRGSTRTVIRRVVRLCRVCSLKFVREESKLEFWEEQRVKHDFKEQAALTAGLKQAVPELG
jgi:hypothetical protein